MDIGLCTLSDREGSVERIIEQAAAVGYDCIEVWGGGHVKPGERERCERVREVATRHGLDIAVYGSYLRPGSEDYARHCDDEIVAAEALGADRIRVWAGEQEYGEHDADHWDSTVADLADLSERAAERGIAVTVERHEGSLTDAREGARRLIQAVDAANCGLNYQPLFGIDATTLTVEARALAPISNNVHVQAVPEVGGETRCALEEAFYDVGQVLDPFRTDDFTGSVNVEFVTDAVAYEEAIAADYRYLRSITE